MLLPIALLLAAGPNLRAELQRTYDGYADACLHHDLERTMAFLTPDVVWKYPGGRQQTAAEIRPELKRFCDSLRPGATMRFTLERVVPQRDGSVAAFVALFVNAPLADGGSRPPRPPARWHDTWVRGKSGWQNKIGELLPAGRAR